MKDARQNVQPALSPMEEYHDGQVVIPVIAERAHVSKVVVDRASVRIHKSVHEQPEVITELLTSDQVEVERISINQIVDAAPAVRVEGDVTIISVVEEVLVVTKQLRLKEELRITRKRNTTEYRQEVLLRKEEVTVERISKNVSNAPAVSKARKK